MDLTDKKLNKSPGNVWLPVVGLVLVAIVLFGLAFVSGAWPFGDGENGVKKDGDEGIFCIQVITPARNLATGEVKDFSTPCDVPEGWGIIGPEEIES